MAGRYDLGESIVSGFQAGQNLAEMRLRNQQIIRDHNQQMRARKIGSRLMERFEGNMASIASLRAEFADVDFSDDEAFAAAQREVDHRVRMSLLDSFSAAQHAMSQDPGNPYLADYTKSVFSTLGGMVNSINAKTGEIEAARTYTAGRVESAEIGAQSDREVAQMRGRQDDRAAWQGAWTGLMEAALDPDTYMNPNAERMIRTYGEIILERGVQSGFIDQAQADRYRSLISEPPTTVRDEGKKKGQEAERERERTMREKGQAHGRKIRSAVEQIPKGIQGAADYVQGLLGVSGDSVNRVGDPMRVGPETGTGDPREEEARALRRRREPEEPSRPGPERMITHPFQSIDNFRSLLEREGLY